MEKEERQRVSKTTGSSRGGEPQPYSFHAEEIYDTNFFTSLKSGRVRGSAAHSNMRNFHLRFEMYEDKGRSTSDRASRTGLGYRGKLPADHKGIYKALNNKGSVATFYKVWDNSHTFLWNIKKGKIIKV